MLAHSGQDGDLGRSKDPDHPRSADRQSRKESVRSWSSRASLDRPLASLRPFQHRRLTPLLLRWQDARLLSLPARFHHASPPGPSPWPVQPLNSPKARTETETVRTCRARRSQRFADRPTRGVGGWGAGLDALLRLAGKETVTLSVGSEAVVKGDPDRPYARAPALVMVR